MYDIFYNDAFFSLATYHISTRYLFFALHDDDDDDDDDDDNDDEDDEDNAKPYTNPTSFCPLNK